MTTMLGVQRLSNQLLERPSLVVEPDGNAEKEELREQLEEIVKQLHEDIQSAGEGRGFPPPPKRQKRCENVRPLVTAGLSCGQLWHQVDLSTMPVVKKLEQFLLKAESRCAVASIAESTPDPSDDEGQKAEEVKQNSIESSLSGSDVEEGVGEDEENESKNEEAPVSLEEMEKFVKELDERMAAAKVDEDDDDDESDGSSEESDSRPPQKKKEKKKEKKKAESDEEAQLDELLFKMATMTPQEGSDLESDKASVEYEDDDEVFNKDELPAPAETEDSNGQPLTELEEVENQLVGPKHWSLLGEAAGNKREKNSLLEVHLSIPQFNNDLEAKASQALAATEEGRELSEDTNSLIELLLKNRIKESNFDDVVKKIDLSLFEKKDVSTAELDFDKSKVGLSELYEEKYKKEVLNLKTKNEEILDRKHSEILDLFAKIVNKLDSLTHQRSIPKPINTATNKTEQGLASIQVEDSIPAIIAGDVNRATPRERFGLTKEKLKHEMERAEKLALRRAMKTRFKKRNQQKQSSNSRPTDNQPTLQKSKD